MLSDRLKSKYNNLTKREQEIIKTLESNLHTIDDLSINNIAEITYSSTTSISRLAQKLGMTYEEFKFFINNEKKISIENIYFENNIIEASELIKDASRIYILCVGQSRHIGNYLKDIFFKFGLNVNLITESDTLNSLKNILRSNDLVIYISSSGNTNTLVNVDNQIIAIKPKIITITSKKDGKLNNNADIMLIKSSPLISKENYSISLQSGLMTLIDDLILAIMK